MFDPIKDEVEKEVNILKFHTHYYGYVVKAEHVESAIERHIREKEYLRKKVEEYESKLSGWIDITREKELEAKLKIASEALKPFDKMNKDYLSGKGCGMPCKEDMQQATEALKQIEGGK